MVVVAVVLAMIPKVGEEEPVEALVVMVEQMATTMAMVDEVLFATMEAMGKVELA